MISAKDANKIVETVRENIELSLKVGNYLRELENEIIRLSKNGLCEANLSFLATEMLYTTFDGPLKDAVVKELKSLGYFTDGLRACWGVNNGIPSDLTEEEKQELINKWNEKRFTQEPREIKYKDGGSAIVYNKNASKPSITVVQNGTIQEIIPGDFIPDPLVEAIAKEEEKGSPCERGAFIEEVK